jgi:hypothetical protein
LKEKNVILSSAPRKTRFRCISGDARHLIQSMRYNRKKTDRTSEPGLPEKICGHDKDNKVQIIRISLLLSKEKNISYKDISFDQQDPETHSINKENTSSVPEEFYQVVLHGRGNLGIP